VLLRRRLQGLFGRSFQLEVRSEIGEGTTMRIPFRKRLAVNLEAELERRVATRTKLQTKDGDDFSTVENFVPSISSS